MKVFLLLAGTLLSLWKIEANDFSSFLSTNASLAIVIDEEYMMKKKLDILPQVQKIVDETVREKLKGGGLNVRYFQWSFVRLKKDFIAAITITNCERTWNFYQTAEISSILLIAITDNGCPRLPMNKSIMIPIIERGEEVPQLLLDIKVQDILKWKSTVVLFDSSIENKATEIITALAHENQKENIKPVAVYLYSVNVHLRNQKRRFIIREAIRQFSRKKNSKFIIFTESIEDVIEAAVYFDMFNVYNQWLFFLPTGIDETNFTSLTQGLNEGANVAFAANKTIVGCQETIICTMGEILIGFVSALAKVIREEGALYGQISDEEWEAIRLTKKERQNEMLTFIVDFLKDSSQCSGCSQWAFKSLVSWGKTALNTQNLTNPSTELNDQLRYGYLDVGYWSPMLGFIAKDVLFPHIEHRFRNISLDVVSYHNPPWQILKRNKKGDVVGTSGIVIELLKELSNKLNFTIRLHNVLLDDENIYMGNDNETTSDLLGSLTNDIPAKVVDLMLTDNYFMAAVAATIDEPDSKPYNYTNPISVQKYTFLARKPDEVSRIYLFTAPFTTTTWLALLGVLLLTPIVLYFVNILVPTEELKTYGLCKVYNCFWYIFGSLLQQGGMYLPKADSGRVVIGVWWIAVIVLVTTYCGNLVAFLTFPKFQPGINYLYETFGQHRVYKFGLRNGTFFEKYAATSSRNDFKQFMERVTIYQNSSTEDIDAVQRGERINIDWRINLQLTIQKHFEKDKECNFILGKEDFVDERIGLILPVASPYLDLINDQIKRLNQMGFLDRWHQMYLPSMDKCSGKSLSRQITNHKVNLIDMQGCFLVLLFGFTFALFTIFIEFWYKRLYLIHRNKFDKFAT